jgi:tetratricopeptide (TPR) repeat protein
MTSWRGCRGGPVTDRLVVDVTPDGRLSVSVWLEGEFLPSQPVAPPQEFVSPLDGEVLEEIRWYLEDYLRAPYGVYADRGTRVAEELPRWGRALFTSALGAGAARDAYLRVRARERVGSEIVFRSAAASFLALPWELLRDPDRPAPLVLDGFAVSRSLPTGGLADVFRVGGELLRVLMVISRPLAPDDVGYRTVARPLLERLEAVRGRVEVVVLRPPTLEALEETLARAHEQGEPFDVVHFDGHGVLPGRPGIASGLGPPVTLEGASKEGVLVFEKRTGGADEVGAATLARILGLAQVPVVVINACQSGAIGKDLEASVATRLLREGVASVVAMAYSVYAVAAAEFMAAFYERLFAGDTVADAVAAGRRRLARRAERPSPKGQMRLEDWVVPVGYERGAVKFPYLRAERSSNQSLDELLDRIGVRGRDENSELEPVGVFVGRDTLFYELEVALRLQRVVVLHGQAGAGKTELAKAFGRWWRDTGGLDDPEGVIFYSFEPGLAAFGLDAVLAEVGLRMFGVRFAQLEVDERESAVERLLRERRLLLIWDNFESVYTMPDPTGVTPPLDEDQRDRLRAFVRRLAGTGRSGLAIISRSDESWLGDVRRIHVGGLAPDEAAEYADELLAPYPGTARQRATQSFVDLLEWLDGNPLSMRLVLPHLATTEAGALLERLRMGGLSIVGGDGGRLDSLDASIAYSYIHLSERARRLLPAVCLFHGVAQADVLAEMSASHDVPERFAGPETEAWVEVLDEAAAVGLVAKLDARMYGIHPALPGYLAMRWRAETEDAYEGERGAATRALIAAYAGFASWAKGQLDGGDAALALAFVARQRSTLGYLLRLGLDEAMWSLAHPIAYALLAFLDARGLYEEGRAWVDRARVLLEGPGGAPPAIETAAGDLWLFFVSSQANREISSGHFSAAEARCREILEMFDGEPQVKRQPGGVGIVYNQLGTVAQERGRLDEAEAWYTKSLAAKKQVGDRRGIATTLHELGNVAARRGLLDEAADWYAKTLALVEELGDWPRIAMVCHQVGKIAQMRGSLTEAEEWLKKALAIKAQLGDRASIAATYNQLGIVARLSGKLDEAETWHLRELGLEEPLRDRHRLAHTYHQLGIVAQERERLDEAEEWFRNALAIREEVGDRRSVAEECHQLGIVAQLREQLDAADNWYTKALAIEEEFDDRPNLLGTYFHLGTVAEMRGRLDEAEAWYTKACTVQRDLAERPHFAHPWHQRAVVAQLRGRLDDAEDHYSKALAISSRCGDGFGVARSLWQLALLAEAGGEDAKALEWTVRFVALFDDTAPHALPGPGPEQLARLANKLGAEALQACWAEVTRKPLPPAVRDFVKFWPSAADGAST